jgi:hypothetical protein
MVSTLAAALLAALGLSGPPAQPAAPPPSGPAFFVAGHGWGHGIGLAQYGAYGYALHGWTHDRIVAHYYPGTTLGQAPVKRVRVLLVPSAKRVVIASRSPFTVRDGAGKTHRLSAGKHRPRRGPRRFPGRSCSRPATPRSRSGGAATAARFV